jgi:hypothetical protein
LPTSGPTAAGDDFRRIDWNAYARLERFFIKLFVEEEDLTVHLWSIPAARWTGASPTSCGMQSTGFCPVLIFGESGRCRQG